ncbi:hypothetical protein [Nocardia huaxiensis]|uniref:Ig-like domain-containing protein n=1 Tax=Nocardia huaxiensis TaxID=2755382 RepID=A0A7D6ZFD0_9NOCA|nr:hypothetical protein [Nocardia huaxiensis]QLY32258.1 hypothetical protein H0264_08320 [Nocardia huaxiensis]UFS94039.1 hypothetical protein LPY97_25100 [Nocardia huaxiensis]
MRITKSGRRIGAGLAGLTVAGATAVVIATSPTASATVDAVTVTGAADYKVGQTYTLSADLSGASVGLLVYWSDNGESLTPVGKVPWPVGHASLDWTPRSAGQHILTAAQGDSTKSIVVTVTDDSNPPTTNPTTPPTTTPPTTVPTTTPETTAPATTSPSTGGSGSSGSGSGSGSSSGSGLLRGLFSGSSR